MEVGFTVYDKGGIMHQTILDLPNGMTLPSVGDGLIYDGLLCTIEKRDFQVISVDNTYGWSLVAKEKADTSENQHPSTE